jgi:flagellin
MVMSLTVTNLNTLQLLNVVNRTSSAQSNVLTQLSTGYKINKASDNPAGLIALEKFNSELTAVSGALDNNQRADAMLSTAEAGITEISGLLQDIEGLAQASVSDSTLSNAEIQANQAQIDNALAAIDRIVNTTTFNGKQLLNGAQAIQVTGLDTTKVNNLRVYSRGNSTSDVNITVKLNTAATSATGAVTIGGAFTLSAATQVVVNGALGSQTISLSSGDNAAAIITKINAASSATGVDAVANGVNIRLESSATGSDAFVEFKVLSGGGLTSPGAKLNDVARTTGTDVKVTVDGQLVTGDGKNVSYNANGLSMEFTAGASLDAVTGETFTVKATGGMTFQLGVDSTTRSTVGLDSLAAYTLGGGDAVAYLSDLKSGGSADLDTGTANTLKAVQRAIEQVAAARGRIGGFQKFQVQTSINSLTATQESLTAAKSVIADTDYAQATAELNRQSVLLNSGMSLLGLANQQASQILSLLG